MPLWNPPTDHVGRKEHIGRRLFDEPLLAGATGQKGFGGLLLRHFEEARSDEFSVDRLGRTGVDKSITRFLRPLADAAGKTFRTAKTFNGWVVLKADELEKSKKGSTLGVVPSPLKCNPYHAHIDTRHFLESVDDRHYHIALYLRELFTTKGKMHIIEDQGERQGLIRFVLLKIKRWFSERLSVWIAR
jgi:hypothetical protein